VKKQLTFINQLAPDVQEILLFRFQILRYLNNESPLGRRSLAQRLGVTERVLRKEIDLLRQQQLISTSPAGMELTPRGEALVTAHWDLMYGLLGLHRLEKDLAAVLGVPRVIVVPGDVDKDPVVKQDIGRAGARILLELLQERSILAISGGTTCAAVADMLYSKHSYPGVTVVPARGGLGEEVEYQANTIAAAAAKKLQGSYRMLHLPDSLSEEALSLLLKEKGIQDVLQLINAADLLLHGIGTAREMAERRSGRESVCKLDEKGAVGEFFGHYFNNRGEIVGSIPSIGLYLERLQAGATRTIIVAGGHGKAEAIKSIVGNHHRGILITDEAAARAITGEDNF